MVLILKNHSALVPSLYKGKIAVIDMETGKVIKKIAVGSGPHGIIISADNSRAYVSNVNSNTVSIVDLVKYEVIGKITLQERDYKSRSNHVSPMWLSENDTKLYYYNPESMDFDVYDVENGKLVESEGSSGFIYQVKTHPLDNNIKYILKMDLLYSVVDGLFEPKQVWQLCSPIVADAMDLYSDGKGLNLLATVHRREPDFYHVKLADLDSLLTLGAYPVPGEPVQVSITKDGKRLFVLGKTGTISILDPQLRIRISLEDKLLCTPPEYSVSSPSEQGMQVGDDGSNAIADTDHQQSIEQDVEEPDPGKSLALKGEKEKLHAAFNKAMHDNNALQEFFDTSTYIAKHSQEVKKHAFQMADHTTKLLINQLKGGNYKTAEDIVAHYIDMLLPSVGLHEKSKDVASNAIVLSVVNHDDVIAARVFSKILGPDFDITAERNEILLYNMACYYAVHKEKQQMLLAIQQALKQGKMAEQFMSDPDFKNYWKDPDFLSVLGAH